MFLINPAMLMNFKVTFRCFNFCFTIILGHVFSLFLCLPIVIIYPFYFVIYFIFVTTFVAFYLSTWIYLGHKYLFPFCSAHDCKTINISCTNFCTWGPFINILLIVLYTLATNMERALLALLSSVLSFLVHNYLKLFLWLFFYSQKLFCYKIFWSYSLSLFFSAMAPVCMIWFSSLLLFFYLLYNFTALVLKLLQALF